MSFYSFERGQISIVWDRQRQRQTAILTHNFFSFSWPHHAVLSSRSHVTFLLLLRQRLPNQWPAHGSQPKWGALSDCKLVLIQDSHWLWPSRRHLQISFQNTHAFPLNHMTDSAYLHMCVLFREIPNWQLD